MCVSWISKKSVTTNSSCSDPVFNSLYLQKNVINVSCFANDIYRHAFEIKCLYKINSEKIYAWRMEFGCCVHNMNEKGMKKFSFFIDYKKMFVPNCKQALISSSSENVYVRNFGMNFLTLLWRRFWNFYFLYFDGF